MKTGFVCAALVLLAVCLGLGKLYAEADPTKDARIEHGRYLVNQVAMCVQCHSPRDANGDIIKAKLLQGAPIPFTTPYANDPWAFQAPHIAGLPGYTVEDGVKLLTEGIGANGQRPKRPMPPFRFSKTDAEDVVAYLKSLS
jgi:mono/diheme cytochrome c family protein